MKKIFLIGIFLFIIIVFISSFLTKVNPTIVTIQIKHPDKSHVYKGVPMGKSFISFVSKKDYIQICDYARVKEIKEPYYCKMFDYNSSEAKAKENYEIVKLLMDKIVHEKKIIKINNHFVYHINGFIKLDRNKCLELITLISLKYNSHNIIVSNFEINKIIKNHKKKKLNIITQEKYSFNKELICFDMGILNLSKSFSFINY